MRASIGVGLNTVIDTGKIYRTLSSITTWAGYAVTSLSGTCKSFIGITPSGVWNGIVITHLLPASTHNLFTKSCVAIGSVFPLLQTAYYVRQLSSEREILKKQIKALQVKSQQKKTSSPDVTAESRVSTTALYKKAMYHENISHMHILSSIVPSWRSAAIAPPLCLALLGAPVSAAALSAMAITRIICFIYERRCHAFHAATLQKMIKTVFSASDVNGRDIPITFPQNKKEFIQQLQEKVPDLILQRKPRGSLREKFYLQIKGELDINRAFFALQEIYNKDIACDTATFLLLMQKRHKQLLLSDLYHFYKARTTIFHRMPLPLVHPYHIYRYKIMRRFGVIKWAKDQPVSLNKILPYVGSQAVISVNRHIGLVQKTSDNGYVVSGWTPEEGVKLVPVAGLLPEGFIDEVGKFKKIEEYIILPVGESVLQKLDRKLSSLF